MVLVKNDNISSAVACDTTSCGGVDKKCINGFCQQGKRYNDLTILIMSGKNAGKWKCQYHYQWTDGTQSNSFTEYNDTPCDINP